MATPTKLLDGAAALQTPQRFAVQPSPGSDYTATSPGSGPGGADQQDLASQLAAMKRELQVRAGSRGGCGGGNLHCKRFSLNSCN